ncbi:class I SAM-dependent methyltransferase [Streptomyces xiaopingdaonensis]|uniref:class I SAM-dependent methyltransferase n=1 Tax=Streptomyces xiaopingdaonensis TaxID=1565415 RepID=UPI001ED91CD5|nr:class I SAM-dependent methyltransferase [Streptomyces xiaopingdaonensis]
MSLPEYWDKYQPGRVERPAADLFQWSQFPGHGPGPELLGSPASVLELGCGPAAEAAYLARRGTRVTALDFSPVQIARARNWWVDLPGLALVEADACAWLDHGEETFDAAFSCWGAAWFVDPEELLPRVCRRLVDGGRFVVAHAAPGDVHGPQLMRGKWLEGRDSELRIHRYQYPPEAWEGMLKRAGFTHVSARVLPPPGNREVGTLIATARR